MKRFDVLPTEENIYKTYVENSIGRVHDVDSFVSIINSMEGGCSIAIDSSWGNGKTFFVKQAKMIIDAFNPNNPFSDSENGKKILGLWEKNHSKNPIEIEPMITSYFDAWEHDDDDDPLLSIVYEIMNENYCLTNIPNKRDWTDILANIAETVTSRNISNLVESAKGRDLFENIKGNIELREQISSFFNSLLPENGNKLIVFIDELDRCSPVFAVKLLERIKRYLLNDSVVFVFSINQLELQHTIKRFYGEELDACRYLDRFFDLRIELPELDLGNYKNTFGIPDLMNLRERTCIEFAKYTHMSLREMSKYFQISRKATYAVTDKKDKSHLSVIDMNTERLLFSVITPVAIGLRMMNLDEYNKLINGTSPEWLINFLFRGSLFGKVVGMLTEDNIEPKLDVDISSEDARNKVVFMYSYLFNHKDDPDYGQEITFGRVTLSTEYKSKIIEAANMASKYSDIEQ
jgi:hypothetical protein